MGAWTLRSDVAAAARAWREASWIRIGDVVDVRGPFPCRLGLATVHDTLPKAAKVIFADGKDALIDYRHLERVEL